MSKISLETIASIIGPKYLDILKQGFVSIGNIKKIEVKKLELAKIPDNSLKNSDRLITFQSELQYK